MRRSRNSRTRWSLTSRTGRLRDSAAEHLQFRNRALLALLLVTLGLGVLGARFVFLQVVSYDEFHTRSERNRIKPRPVVPARGLIYDRNGTLLADNVPAYRLELTAEQIVDMELTLAALAEVLPVSDDEIERFRTARSGKRRFQPVPLKLRLSESEVARFAVERHRFPGVDVVPYLSRSYPGGSAFAHVVGYVGRIDTADLERLDPVQYRESTHIGKSGIERYYESRLHGRVGYEEVETNAEGRVLRVLKRVPAIAGEHLYLSIDADLQMRTAAAFDGQPGSAVVIDPRNGEVLAMVNVPSFDPNLFVQGMGRAEYQALLNAPYRPLFNRAVQGGYGPGSTLKPFIALAGLEAGIRRPEDRTLSTGAFRLPGHSQEYRDWRKGGHGWVDMSEAVAQSVNTYFYQLAMDLGIDRLSESMARFGFGAPTGIDLSGESAGVLPSRQWKREQLNQAWYPGETVITGIGQGFWVTTPLQLAHASAILASGGVATTPHLLRAMRPTFDAEIQAIAWPEGERIIASTSPNLPPVVASMVAVMHGPSGTARRAAADATYRIAGKTGTAQRVGRTGDQSLNPAEMAEHLRHQALFVGFAPAEEPRVAIAVVVEHGGSGSLAAAPIARRILDAWLLRELAWNPR